MGSLTLAPAFSQRAFVARDPLLVFGGGSRCGDQRMGLSLYGPAPSVGGPQRDVPVEISVGIVGTGTSTSSVNAWLRSVANEILFRSANGSVSYFPGLHTASPLRTTLRTDPRVQVTLSNSEIAEAVAPSDPGERIDRVTRLFSRSFGALASSDPAPQVVLCPLPDKVVERCVTELDRFGRVRPSPRSARQPRGRQARLEDFIPDPAQLEAEAETEEHYGNLWRALKIEAMRVGLPLQVIWGRTLEQGQGVQNPAVVAWNLFSGIYYKVRGRLWHLPVPATPTCYIGLSFYHERTSSNDRLNCSMAQIFSDSGDGLVFRGGSLASRTGMGLTPRLDAHGARTLVNQCLSLYRDKMGAAPARVVIHKSSRFSLEEREGVESALASAGVKQYDMVAIEPGSTYQYYRQGRYPPLRGTSIRMPDGRWLIYTRGYVPLLHTYSGPATPSPLSILEHFGESSIDRVLEDLMGLTRLNWNSTDHSCLLPVTLAFSRRVGSVLSEYRIDGEPGTQLKFYM